MPFLNSSPITSKAITDFPVPGPPWTIITDFSLIFLTVLICLNQIFQELLSLFLYLIFSLDVPLNLSFLVLRIKDIFLDSLEILVNRELLFLLLCSCDNKRKHLTKED